MSRARRRHDRTAADATKERPKMSKRLATLAVSIGAALLLFALPAAAQAASPWWQVSSGARPSNLWEPGSTSMTQEVTGELFFGLILAARVEVGGETIGCLGTGTLAPFGGPSADEICEAETGFPVSETAPNSKRCSKASTAPAKSKSAAAPPASFPSKSSPHWGPSVVVTVLEAELFGELLPMGANVGAEITSEGSGRLTSP